MVRLALCFSILDKSVAHPRFFRRECQLVGGVQTYYLAHFCRKLHDNTRMHSSRIRVPPAAVAVSGKGFLRGDFCPGGAVCPGKGCLPRGLSPRRCLPGVGVSTQGDIYPRGRSTWGVNRITDRFKNITFPKLCSRTVKTKIGPGVHIPHVPIDPPLQMSF